MPQRIAKSCSFAVICCRSCTTDAWTRVPPATISIDLGTAISFSPSPSRPLVLHKLSPALSYASREDVLTRRTHKSYAQCGAPLNRYEMLTAQSSLYQSLASNRLREYDVYPCE
jgi:hypothetical protein